MVINLDKDQIIHWATNIYEEALTASSYFEIINQYHKNVQKYNDEMNYSPAFYHIVYQALIEGLFMNLAKIYDSDKEALTLRTLLSEMKTISIDNFSEAVAESYKLSGHKFQHRLKPEEECFYKNEVSEKHSICNTLKIDYTFTEVDLSYDELLLFYTKKLHSINPSVQNLINQRNKVFAHNDRVTNFQFDKIYERSPIKKDDAIALITVALDVSCFCIEILTGTSKAREYSNINDWESSLEMIKLGAKYDDMDLQELCLK